MALGWKRFCKRDIVHIGLTTDKNSEFDMRWAPKDKWDAYNLLLSLVSTSKRSLHEKICLVLNS